MRRWSKQDWSPTNVQAAKLAWQFGYFETSDLQEWSISIYSSQPENPVWEELVEIASIHASNSQAGLEITHLLDFAIEKEKAAIGDLRQEKSVWGKQIWHHYLRQYIEGSDPPSLICEVLLSFEDEFDYPEWLGDMYSCCDWNDVTIRPVNPASDPIYLEAQRLLEAGN